MFKKNINKQKNTCFFVNSTNNISKSMKAYKNKVYLLNQNEKEKLEENQSYLPAKIQYLPAVVLLFFSCNMLGKMRH
jgi:hypothetical protein